MSKLPDEMSIGGRVFYFPLTRIAVGIVVCVFVILGTNGIVRSILVPEGDVARIIRWLLSAFALLGSYYFLFKYYEKRDIIELSKTGLFKYSLLGFFMGTLCISFIIIVFYVLGYYRVLAVSSTSALLMMLVYFTTVGLFEEVVFRGIIYRITEESLGTNLALIVSALIFGIAHLPNEHANVISVVSAASAGMLAGALLSLTKRLWLPISFHTAWNWSQASLGVAVSGIDMPGFLKARLEGPELVTGGAFGPENSIITVLLLIILFCVAYYLTLKKRNVIRRAIGKSQRD